MSVRSRVAVLLFTACLQAGRFGLDRFGINIGLFGEPRWWLIAMLLGTVLLAPAQVLWSGRLKLFYVSLLLYLSFVITSALWTPDADRALEQIEDIPLLILLMGSMPLVFGENPQASVQFFLKLLYWIATLFGVLGLVMGSRAADGRLSVLGGGPNVYARIMEMGVFAAIYLWTRTGKVRWLITIPFLCAAAVLSGSRGGIISLLAGVGVLMLTTQKPGRLLKFVAVMMILSALPIYLYADRLEMIVATRFVETYQKQNIGGREFIYPHAVDTFKKHVLVGAGVDGFRQTGGAGLFYAHNMFLEVAAEGGLVGLALMFSVLLQCGSAFRHSVSLEGKVMAGTFVALFLSQMTSGTYYDARQMWTSAMLAVMLVPVELHALQPRSTLLNPPPMMSASRN